MAGSKKTQGGETEPSVTSENVPGVPVEEPTQNVETTPPDRDVTREEFDAKDPARADPNATPEEQQGQTAGFPGGKPPEEES